MAFSFFGMDDAHWQARNIGFSLVARGCKATYAGCSRSAMASRPFRIHEAHHA